MQRPSPETYRGRFAPSPTGPLHLGSLLVALGSWLRARQAGGEWLVRIEDLDPPRTVRGASLQQLETLKRFGLVPDAEPLWQGQRSERYEAALASLVKRGIAYPCACSRNDLAPFDGRHPASCVASLPAREPAWRVRVNNTAITHDDAIQGQQQVTLSAGDDFVLKRTDGYSAYQLAVVVDDAEQGITEIVRGADLLEETPRQIWLQRSLGHATPNYAHLPILTNAEGGKLGKSTAARAVDSEHPLPVLRTAIRLLGAAPDGNRIDSLLA
ncbi:MAG: tRNA glutamyl-Q(34) synthetase GluQRS, partial [Xanthomonadales bacterium]|nr:tRNA glutamyl-Q(34) synthetase GluQRS [Xanthomonadales bacterium]